MKVITLISGGDSGGAKTHVHSLLQNLSRTIEVTMVCFLEGPFAQEARELGIPTVVLSGRNLLRTYRTLKRMIREGGYQLIHCHGARGNMMGALLRRSTGLPVVTTVHSDYRLDYLGRPLSRLTYGTINTIALRRLDYRIGVSDAMTDLLIKRGFDPDRLFTIYNGIDFTPRTPALSREEYFRSVGLEADGDSVVVGIAARLNPVKDIATLVRGFAKAHRECPSLRLLIAGDGEQMSMLKGLAAELGVERQVCFAGWVSDTDSFYHAIDINTLTSLSETFPYSLTEGARAALPTIASRVGGVPYLIEHGVHGLLFEAGDADTLARHLITLAKDPTLRQHLGERLYQRGREDFSLESTLERQLNIYETILRRQSRKKGRRDGALVCGAYGRGNAGDDAILEAILQEMRSIDPDMPITVLSKDPRSTRLTYRVRAVHRSNFLAWHAAMWNSRLYINGGGSLIQDVTSRRSLWFYLANIRAAKRAGNRVQMYGCGIGPVTRESHRSLAAKIINKYVDVITLREPDSLEELRAMGVTEPEVLLTADPALILQKAPDDETDSVLLRAGIPPHGNYLCFALRRWKGFEEKAPLFGAAAEYAYRTYGLTPVFVAVEKHLDPGAGQLAARGLTIPHYFLDDAGGAGTIIGALSRMQAVVSMRLHALIFAAGQGIPLAGVVYDPKVSAFLRYIGQEQFVDLAELTGQNLCAMMDQCVAQAAHPEAQAAAVRNLQAMEQKNVEVARRLLKG
jgi:polysaccharide pyruvyl transferase CsaB